jgi:hypothetical protein
MTTLPEEQRVGLGKVYSPQAIAWAQKECAPALAIIRESYRPSESIESMLIAAFLHGAACAFRMDSELGDVEPLGNVNAG